MWKYSKIAVFVAGLVTAASCLAEEGFVTRRKIEPARIDELVTVLREEMEPGGRFERIETDERDRVEAALAQMSRALEGKATLEDLDDQTRVKVFNLQERVNAILLKKDNDRVVCEYRETVGSRRKQALCETVGERIARRSRTKNELDRLNKRIQQCKEMPTPGTGGNNGGGGVVCVSG